MVDVNFNTLDGTRYTAYVEYIYDYRPVVLSDDPNHSCDDESVLDMNIYRVCPAPSMVHWEEILDSFNDGALYEILSDRAIEDYFGDSNV